MTPTERHNKAVEEFGEEFGWSDFGPYKHSDITDFLLSALEAEHTATLEDAARRCVWLRDLKYAVQFPGGKGEFRNDSYDEGIEAAVVSILEVLVKPSSPFYEPVEWARRFHDIYERLAPQFGYETRPDTKEFDPESKNGKLMTAVCGEIVREVRESTKGNAAD